MTAQAQFIHDIDFDVFRIMRDHDIAYGSHQSGLDESYMQRLSQHAKSFLDENPGLANEGADFSWLLESAFGKDNDASDPEAMAIGAQDDGMALDDWLLGGGDEDAEGSPVEVLASGLGGIYRSSLWPTFEVGSLVFLRSRSHQAFLEYLEKVDESDMPIYSGKRSTLNASIFLPQKSVLRLGKVDQWLIKEPMPIPTPRFSLVRLVGDGPTGNKSRRSAKRWELLAHDICRQGVMPGLRSGHTVIDERNFVLNASKRGAMVMM